MKFSEIWYVDASQQKKCYKKKFFLDSGFFWSFFNQKKAKIDKNEENWQNQNRLMKLSEIWYLDASQQTKCYNYFSLDFGLFWPFFNQKTAKIDQK